MSLFRDVVKINNKVNTNKYNDTYRVVFGTLIKYKEDYTYTKVKKNDIIIDK